MPTYEYICAKCNHHFDIIQSISNAPLRICVKEKCGQKKWGKGKVKRAIVGGGGLIFKGSGFYMTDYRSEGYKEAAKKEAAAASPPKEGKSDGKKTPEPKSSAASGEKGAAAVAAPAPPPKTSPKKDS